MKITTVDGVKIDFANEWVHLRKSNTEPIIRIYNSASQVRADTLALRIIDEIKAVPEFKGIPFLITKPFQI
jgi:phosphomannomutase